MKNITTTKQMGINLKNSLVNHNISMQDVQNKTGYDKEDIQKIIDYRLLISFEQWKDMCSCIGIDFTKDILGIN